MGRALRSVVSALVLVVLTAAPAWAYIEIPYTLGKVIEESGQIVLMEVTRIQKERGLIIFRKIKVLKGKFDGDELRHNIGNGERGFHPREAKNIMTWAAPGERAIFFCNGDASETCIGTYWYQCYRENQWWGMSHAEPYLLRTYCGDVDSLATAVAEILAGKEVVIPCLVDANRAQLHERKGKLQRLRASRTRMEYNAQRDFVGFGAEGVDVVEYKTEVLLAEGTGNWRYLPAKQAAAAGDRWVRPDFDDRGWRTGKAPLGYGEDELANRRGTIVAEEGQAFVFRREFQASNELLARKGANFQLQVAADNCARVYLNGEMILDEGQEDHEFSYWNQMIDLQTKQLRPGRNVVAIYVFNGAQSSDLYLDAQVVAETPLPSQKPATRIVGAVPQTGPGSATGAVPAKSAGTVAPEGPLVEIVVDKTARTITIPARIAARKLPNLAEVYPLEVIATAPPPRGRKAHETVVTTDARPSQVHAALESLGLKPGTPAKGGEAKASGPELTIHLRLKDSAGPTRLVPIERALVDRKSSQPLPTVAWHFTGSVRTQPDPERDETVYGADLTGTLVAIFPVTNETVIQSSLTMADEPTLKLETDKTLLPAEGSEVALVIGVK